MTRKITIRYFAWVREKTGISEETIEIGPDVVTVADLVGTLAGRSEQHAEAFKSPATVRAALDKAHVKPQAAIGNAREIAFFPPVTGG